MINGELMGIFRFSIGNASCKSLVNADPVMKDVGLSVQEKVEYLKKLSPEQLDRWSESETLELEIANKRVLLTVFKDKFSSGKSLIIVQAFYSTLKHPNYFSLAGVGRICAEGFFIDSSGIVTDAEDSDLWAYR